MRALIKKIIPKSGLKFIRYCIEKIQHIYENFLIKRQPKKHERALKLLREKYKNNEKIKVAFFVIHGSVWKYENLYKLLSKDSNYETIIIICPYVVFGKKRMLEDMRSAYQIFYEKGYKVMKAYDENLDSYIDIKNEINPDIIFFTNPYKGLTKNEYYITNFKEKLTFYTSYCFYRGNQYDNFYDLLFHNLVWKIFTETQYHMNHAEKYCRNKSRNRLNTGYIGIEELLIGKNTINNIWKEQSQEKKKIIWAPHHILKDENSNNYSTFEKYFEFMLNIAKKYKNEIQIAFKPHPILKPKLEILWGKDKADSYFSEWKKGENTQLSEGEYYELFLTSDAMIHDSGSFSIEFLYTLKPVIYTTINIDYESEFNDFGFLAHNCHYFANNESEIESLINKVIIEGNDEMKSIREGFYYENLRVDEKPSDVIYRYLNEVLKETGEEKK